MGLATSWLKYLISNGMSHKHKEQPFSGQPQLVGQVAEHQVIKHDLVRVIILNAVYLAGILILYYTNKQHPYLDAWLSKYIKF